MHSLWRKRRDETKLRLLHFTLLHVQHVIVWVILALVQELCFCFCMNERWAVILHTYILKLFIPFLKILLPILNLFHLWFVNHAVNESTHMTLMALLEIKRFLAFIVRFRNVTKYIHLLVFLFLHPNLVFLENLVQFLKQLLIIVYWIRLIIQWISNSSSLNV